MICGFFSVARLVPFLTAVDRPVTDTTLVSLLFLFTKTNFDLYDLHIYLYIILLLCKIFFICIAPWFWYPSPLALVQSMIRMWYIIFYNYIFSFPDYMTINYADQLDIDIFI